MPLREEPARFLGLLDMVQEKIWHASGISQQIHVTSDLLSCFPILLYSRVWLVPTVAPVLVHIVSILIRLMSRNPVPWFCQFPQPHHYHQIKERVSRNLKALLYLLNVQLSLLRPRGLQDPQNPLGKPKRLALFKGHWPCLQPYNAPRLQPPQVPVLINAHSFSVWRSNFASECSSIANRNPREAG